MNSKTPAFSPHGRAIHVLIIEDEMDFVAQLRDSLQCLEGRRFQLIGAGTLAEGMSRLETEEVDLILLDLVLPDSDRERTFGFLKDKVGRIPVVILSGIDDEKLAIETVKQGAQDYLVKGQISTALLVRVMHYAIERKRLGESLREREAFYGLIMDNVQDLIAVLDRDGKRLYNSPSYASLLGSPENLIGTNSIKDVHPEDAQHVKSIFEETVKTGEGRRSEFRLLTRDGAVRYVESQGNAICDEAGNTSRVVVVSRDITERKKAEQELRESEQRYKQLLGSVTDYLYTVTVRDQKPVRITHSPSCAAVTGYLPEEYDKDPGLWNRMIPEKERPAVEAMIAVAMGGKMAPPVEHRILHKNGNIRWVRHATVPHRNKRGEVESYDGLINDVTERKRAEDRLSQSEALYQSLVESLPQCILRKDLNGRFTFVNHQFARTLNRQPKAIVGKTDFDFYPREMALKFREDDLKVMESGDLYETTEQNVAADGTLRFMHVVKIPIRGALGEVAGVQGIFWDVTKSRLAELELRKSDERLQAILDQTPAVIYLKDLEGRYLYINNRFEELFHVRREETVGRTDFDIFPEEAAALFRDNDRTILKEGRSRTIDEKVPQDGGVHYYLSNKFPLFDPGGKAYALCGISTDITERRKAHTLLETKNEELRKVIQELSATRLQLFQAEKLKSIGTLAAGVAHEVKNPLQILLLGMNDLSSSIKTSDNELHLTMADMRDAINRADTIVRGLLDFSRLQELKLVPGDINQVIRDVVRMINFNALNAHVHVDTQLARRLPKIPMDRQKMQQVFINLASNSIEAMPGGGRLTIETRTLSCNPNVLVQGLGDTTFWELGDLMVEVTFRDTGYGIPEEVLPRIFDPFFTTKPTGKGTGLGLPVVQNIIALHGGKMDLKNHPAGGVAIIITLNTQLKTESHENTYSGR